MTQGERETTELLEHLLSSLLEKNGRGEGLVLVAAAIWGCLPLLPQAKRLRVISLISERAVGFGAVVLDQLIRELIAICTEEAET
jgi:hypothetical protein